MLRHLARAMALVFALAAALPASAVTISFDELTANTSRTTVTTQYASLGVTFNSVMAMDFTQYPPYSATFAHSGHTAIEQCFAQEFCNAPIAASFTTGQSMVRVWVGLDYAPQQAMTVYLRGYNSTDALVASDSVNIPAGGAPVPIRLPLSIGAADSSIVRAEVTSSVGFINGVAVDDVEFDRIGPPPPCPATVPPTLTVLRPGALSTTRANRFEYQDSVTSQDPFATRTITVVGPSGTPHAFTGQVAQDPALHTWIYGMLEPGLNNVIVRVADCKGAATRGFQVQYNPLPADLGFKVLAYEVTQSIQDTYHSVPLISGKRTYLRLYLGLTGSLTTLNNVRATLNAFRPGNDPTFQHGPALVPFNVPSLNAVSLDNSVNLLTKRVDLKQSLNFELPPEWTADGQVNFALSNITVDGVGVFAPNVEGGFVNAIGHLRYQEFTPAPSLRIRLVNLPYHPKNKPAEVWTPRQKDNDMLFSWLGRAYPTARVLGSVTTSGTIPLAPGEPILPAPAGFFNPVFDADFANAMVQEIRAMDLAGGTVDPRTHYYGQVFDANGPYFMRGKADSIPSHVASGPTGSVYFGWDKDGSYGDWYGGHELGHTFGRTHAEFCHAQACPEIISFLCPGGYQPYPYPNGALSGGPKGEEGLEVGFDIGDPTFSLAPAALSPAIYTDIMTYCDYEWMSDFTYERILNQLRAENASAPTAQRLKADAAPDAVLLTGMLNLTKKTGALRPAWRMGGLIPTDRPAQSRFHILFKSAGGATLADYPFLPNVDTEAVSGEDISANIAETLPWVANTRRIVVVWDDTTLATLAVSPNAPEVHVVTPNGGETLSGAVNVQWTGSDADGDTLVYTLQYSRDGGDTWRTLSTSLTSNPVTVDLSGLPGATAGKFRVIASDGVNTGYDDSDGVFTVAGKAPTVRIVSPANAANFDSSQVVVLTGQANDVEDGALTGSRLTWSSDLQGVLGTGEALSTQLKPGVHTITLTAKDSDGQTASASITLNVAAAAPVPNPGPNRVAVIGQTVGFNASGSTGFAPLSYQWDIVQKPPASAATMANATAATPSFAPDAAGTYVVQLTVKDGTGLSGVAQVVIIVTGAGNALKIAAGLQTAAPADMPALNVETAPPSTNVIDILDAVRLMRASGPVGAGSGIVTRGPSNRTEVGVVIDDPRLNGRPDVPIVAGHMRVKAGSPPLAVRYNTSNGKWSIEPDGPGGLQDGETYAYVFGPQVRSVTRAAANAPFAWGVRLDDPALNQNPGAVPLATHNAVNNPANSALGLWYSNGGWLAYNESGGAIPNGERYFYTDAGASGGSVTVNRSNLSGGGVILDDPRLNGQPKAVVLAQHALVNQYITSPLAVQYNPTSGRWIALPDDGGSLTFFEKVNYLVVQ